MAGVAVPLAKSQYIDPLTDQPIAFGTVEHYVPFSLTPKSTWADQTQTVLNGNPVVLDAAGQAAIWGDGLYRQILKRQDGSTVWDVVTGFVGSGGGGGGSVVGPGATSPGHFALWGDATGTLLTDGGVPGALAFSSLAPVANGGTGSANAIGARANLGLVIGTDVEAHAVSLTALGALTPAANKLAYYTGASSAALTDFTSFARSLLDDSDGPTMLATLGAEPRGIAVGVTTYTADRQIDLTDAGLIIEMNVGSANNLTVPANVTTAFPVKTRIDIVQYGAGQTTVVPAGGVTIRAAGGALKLRTQYSGATLYKRGTDEWVLLGDITT